MGYLHTEFNGELMKGTIPTLKGNYGAFYDGLYDTIVHKKPCLVSGQDGWKVMKIIEAAQLSNKDQKLIPIHP